MHLHPPNSPFIVSPSTDEARALLLLPLQLSDCSWAGTKLSGHGPFWEYSSNFLIFSTKITNTLNWHHPHVLAFPDRYSKSYLIQVTTFLTFFLKCTKDRCLVCIAYKFWPVCTCETISVSREWTHFHCLWFTCVRPSACLGSGHVSIAPGLHAWDHQRV